MDQSKSSNLSKMILVGLILIGGAVLIIFRTFGGSLKPQAERPKLNYQPRKNVDNSGFFSILGSLKPWKPNATLEEIKQSWIKPSKYTMEMVDKAVAMGRVPEIQYLLIKASMAMYEGEAEEAYRIMEQARTRLSDRDDLAEEWLHTVLFFQAVAALRRGENENCIMCRGESSCILPIVSSAIHTHPLGSRLALKHLTECLDIFPDDLEARYLLNIAHMTLGEHPHGVDPKYLLTLDPYVNSEFNIGKFRDIGHLVGVNRLNQAGGAIMDDFDNDGLLDIVITASDPTEHMAYFHNQGDGTFEDRTKAAGLLGQLGGLNCVQTDYNNDGNMDIFIPRGAWLKLPIRPALLRNNGNGAFTDVTEEAGLLDPLNSNSATWADYDNDGHLDLFICCEYSRNRLYHNKGNGTFEEVAEKAGVPISDEVCKGAAWLDYDNDGYPDLFTNNLSGAGRLFHNQRDGTFKETTAGQGIDGPEKGFSCWAWDYDNDGWLDIFATCYDRTLADVVKGMIGQPHNAKSNRLFRNLQGKGFKDMAKEAGLDLCFSTMGSNFGDFDNDGFLDMYLGTGEPPLSSLMPNRMFKNVAGKRFAEISASSGTGHLQKGHGVACGDWDRDGNVDIFEEMGGAINGDKYHNVLFQNPGQGNHWLTLKLIGKKTNRAAIGARIKVVTAGEQPLTVQRHVTSGSSFGANSLQQTIGLAKLDRIASLEIHWPTSGTTQAFKDVEVDQAIEVSEFAEGYRKLDWKPVVWGK